MSVGTLALQVHTVKLKFTKTKQKQTKKTQVYMLKKNKIKILDKTQTELENFILQGL